MNSTWRPNPNAKPFLPSSAYYNVPLPCKRTPLRIQKKGIVSRFIQGILVLVLCITVVVNVIFILDTTSKLRNAKQENSPLDQIRSQLREAEAETNVGPGTSGRTISIEVYSSKDLGSVSVDGTKVLEATDDKGRGISVAVLNQATGAVMATKSFDVYASKDDSDALVLFINMVSDGRILCFAMKDEASMSLKKTAKNLMKTLGSTQFGKIYWRDMFAFVVQKRGKVLGEGFHKTSSVDTWADPVTVVAKFELQSVESSECKWEDNPENQRRKEFCSKYEGYGSVCSCTNPAPLDLKAEPLSDGRKLELPVAIIASNRPHYLFRMIRSILSAHGANPSMMTVFIDGYFDEPLAVARLFSVRGIQHTPISSKNARISQHYKASLTTSFNLYPKAKYLVILEEDLDVSIDFFNYFQQLVPLFEEDDSLYCISAWNDQGYDHSVGDPAMLYRVETMPGLGWVLKRKLYKDELEPQWPTPDKFWDWDMWMRLPEMRKGRECIIPDISRTYHFGTSGVNMHAYFQELYFKKHALNTEPNVKLNVQLAKKDNYEKEIERLLNKAEVLDHSKTPCENKDFIPDTPGKTFVFFIKKAHETDWETWNNVAKCFHLWDLDVRGFHKSLWRFWIKGSHILIVGAPASPYSKYKPESVEPIYMQKGTTQKT